MIEGIPPDEQAEADRLAQAVLDVLAGANTDVCLSALSKVAAHACVAYDDPREAGMVFMGDFIELLEDGITKIPAESIVTIPAPPETN